MRSSFLRRGWPARFWRNLHLWLGVGLFVLLVPIALSGALLVYHDDIDDMMRAPRDGAVAQGTINLTMAARNARAAAGENFQVIAVRFSDDARAPLAVSLRGPSREGERPMILTAYVDRGDGHVLSVVNFRQSFFGFLHMFHENLTVPFYYGRDIVGWGGVAMLTLSLSGLYLWWPRKSSRWARAFAWRRRPATSSNLHYLMGFWICFPLAFVSLTGIYLAWPQQGRAMLSSVTPMSAQQRGGGGGQMMTNPTRSPTDIASAAMTARPTSDLLAIFFPNQGGAWRVQLRENGKSEPLTLMVNDRSGAVSILEPLAGDRIAFRIRWLHEGSHAGEVWRFVVFLSGVIPAALGVTGILIWLRQRRQRALMATQSDRIPLPRASTSAAIGGITPAE